jgi:DNA-3-methyladenine glycosylase II
MSVYKKQINYLNSDKMLKEVIINSLNEVEPSLEFDIYHYLLDSIVSQQLSVKVADIIFNRVLDLFPERYPEAKQLIYLDDEILRKAGLSYRKVSYLKNVAEFSLNNSMEFEFLQKMTDNEIIEYLTQIKGVGKWTVQMLLMFPLDRPDVFPVDDLGIQTNMKAIYGLVSDKNISNSLTKKELKLALEKIAESWKPYRTLASKYIWNWSKT